MICAICPNEIPPDRHWRNKTCSDKCLRIYKNRTQQKIRDEARPGYKSVCPLCKKAYDRPIDWGKTKHCPTCHAIDPVERQKAHYHKYIETHGGRKAELIQGQLACKSKREGKNRGTPAGFIGYYRDYPYMYQTTFNEAPTPENIKRRAIGLGKRTWDGFVNPAVVERRAAL